MLFDFYQDNCNKFLSQLFFNYFVFFNGSMYILRSSLILNNFVPSPSVQSKKILPKGKSQVLSSCSVVSDSLQPHEPQHTRPPCPSPTPRVYPNSCPLSWWYHPTISSSVIPFSSCPQSFPGSESFQMSQFFASGGQSVGVSASISVPPMNTQD